MHSFDFFLNNRFLPFLAVLWWLEATRLQTPAFISWLNKNYNTDSYAISVSNLLWHLLHYPTRFIFYIPPPILGNIEKNVNWSITIIKCLNINNFPLLCATTISRLANTCGDVNCMFVVNIQLFEIDTSASLVAVADCEKRGASEEKNEEKWSLRDL